MHLETHSVPPLRSATSRDTVWVMVWLAVLGTLCALVWFRWAHPVLGYTMDDAFISFRYARHLAQHGAIEWNPGEMQATEGYTSLVWIWVMALVDWVGLDQVVASKWLSSGFLLATALLLGFEVQRLQAGIAMRLLACLLAVTLFAANGHLLLHMVSGMETALAVLLTSAIGVLTVRLSAALSADVAVKPGRLVLLALLVWLSALNRPESLLTSGLAALWLLSRQPARWRLLVNWGLLPFALLVAAYLAWRLHRYGLSWPLPFYIKVGASGRFAGLQDVVAFTHSSIWAVVAVVIGLALPRTRRLVWPLALMFAAHLVFFVFPEHIMGMGYRFLIPIWGLVTLAASIALTGLLDASKGRPWGRTLGGLAAVLLLTASAAANRPREAAGMAWYRDGMASAHIRLGRSLAEVPGRHVIALGDAGAVSYYSGWHVVDTFGLNHRSIAMARARRAYDPALVIGEKPELLVFISRSCEVFDPPLPHERSLFDAAALAGYTRVTSYRFADTYHLQLYRRPDITDTALLSWLRVRQEPGTVCSSSEVTVP